MSYLFFMDESGHDHKNMPYEVRGGVAIPDHQLWAFVQEMRQLELNSFGDSLHTYGTAYGQACLTMVRGIFRLLKQNNAVIFATVVPDTCCKPDNFAFEDYLRKDHVYLFQRYYDYLEEQNQQGLLVMDETEKTEDRRFVDRMYRYFSRTSSGNIRASRVVPVPFFVSSDMSYPIQAADCVIYCINWGFRLPFMGMDKPVRQEVANESATWIHGLQAKMDKLEEGRAFVEWGIKYVDDPFTGSSIKKGGKAHD